MSLPSPRMPAHATLPLDTIDPRRELFLEAMERVWDTSRAQSKAQLMHAAAMIAAKLGGTLVIRAESSVSGRKTPEAGFMSEGFSLTESGKGF